MLEEYLQIFSKLRADRGRDRYPQLTYHRAPHKPSLLLSIREALEEGENPECAIEFCGVSIFG